MITSTFFFCALVRVLIKAVTWRPIRPIEKQRTEMDCRWFRPTIRVFTLLTTGSGYCFYSLHCHLNCVPFHMTFRFVYYVLFYSFFFLFPLIFFVCLFVFSFFRFKLFFFYPDCKTTICFSIIWHAFSWQLAVLYWSLSDSKSLQISRTLFSILAHLNSAVVWIGSILSLPSSHFSRPLEIILTTLTSTIISITFKFHSFF